MIGQKTRIILTVITVTLILGTILTNLFSAEIMPANAAATSSPQIKIINPSTGGDISKNKFLMNNIPKTALNQQIIAQAKKGTPMIIIGSGDPKIMIIAGVHGNELSSQVAALKLANELKNKKLKGTVYIIPMAIPKSTASNIREFENADPNRVANVSGSPTNTLVNLALQKKVKYVAEFHSTEPGGDPGKKVIMCNKATSYESFKIAEYIRAQTNSDIFINSKNPGALKNVLNTERIPTITGEVVADHGTVNYAKVKESYLQMMAFIKYSKII